EKLYDEKTIRIFNTVYYLAKENRPFSDMENLVQLQKLNGLDMGLILHSRLSATHIVALIAIEMIKFFVKDVMTKNRKISVLVDEATTASLRPVLVVTLRVFISDTDLSATFVFLDLVELLEGQS